MLKFLYFFTSLIFGITRVARGVRFPTSTTRIAKAHSQVLLLSRESVLFWGLQIIFRNVAHEAPSVRFVTVPVRNRPDGIISPPLMAFYSKLQFFARGVRLLLIESHEEEKQTLRRG